MQLIPSYVLRRRCVEDWKPQRKSKTPLANEVTADEWMCGCSLALITLTAAAVKMEAIRLKAFSINSASKTARTDDLRTGA